MIEKKIKVKGYTRKIKVRSYQRRLNVKNSEEELRERLEKLWEKLIHYDYRYDDYEEIAKRFGFNIIHIYEDGDAIVEDRISKKKFLIIVEPGNPYYLIRDITDEWEEIKKNL